MIELDKLLKTNTYISPADLSELELLANRYPWFSIAHQLVLTGYKQNNDARFAEKCRQTAAYTLNRKRLYKFLEKTNTKFVEEKDPDKEMVKENIEIKNTNTNDTINDDVLLNFSNEYFSIEDMPPIEVGEDYVEESNDDLITKFINENPRIIPKSSIANLENLIQIEDETEDEPVSEPLAEIYVSQGLYEQAIATYEKLSLLNPEKSIYFASLINNLRNSK